MTFLEQFSVGNSLYSNLAVIGIELVIIILFWMTLGWLLQFVAQQVQKTPALEKYAGRANTAIKLLKVTFLMLFLSLFIIAIGYNGWLISQGITLKPWTLEKLATIPPTFWLNLAITFVKIVVLIVFNRWLIGFVASLLNKAQKIAINWQQLTSNNDVINDFFARLR